LQWIQAYEVEARTLEIVYRTLGTVFSNIQSWQTNQGDLLLMASHEPVHYNAEILRNRLAEEPFKSAMLGIWRANGLEDFMAHYIGNENLTRALQERAVGPLNTDDRSVIEFAFARSVNLAGGFQLPDLHATAWATHNDRPQLVEGEVNWSRVEEGRLCMDLALNLAPQTQAVMTPQQKKRSAAFASYSAGDLPAALRNWRAQPEEPQTLPQLALVAECLAVEGNEAAPRYIDKLAEFLPSDAKAIRAAFFWETKKPEQAAETLEKFLHDLHEDPWPNRDLISRSMRRAENIASSDRSKIASLFLYDALRTPLCAFNNESDRMTTVVDIARYLDGEHAGQYTRAALEAFEPYILWQRKFLQLRKECYRGANSPLAAQAALDFDEFMEHETSPDRVDGSEK
jgi:hypothetical protein